MKLSDSLVQRVWEYLLGSKDFAGCDLGGNRTLMSVATVEFEVYRHVQELSYPGEYSDVVVHDDVPQESSWLDRLVLEMGFPLNTDRVEVSGAILSHSALELHVDGFISSRVVLTKERTSVSASGASRVQCSLLFPIRNGVTHREYTLGRRAVGYDDAQELSRYYAGPNRLKSKWGDQRYLRQQLVQYPSASAFDRRVRAPLAHRELVIGQDFLLVHSLPHAAWFHPDSPEGKRTRIEKDTLAIDRLYPRDSEGGRLVCDQLNFDYRHGKAVNLHTPSQYYPSTWHLEISIMAHSMKDALDFLREWYSQTAQTPSSQVQYMLDNCVPLKSA